MTVQLDSLIIGTKDIESAKLFYQNVFGFVIENQSPYYLSGHIWTTHVEIEEDAPYRFARWAEHNIWTYKNSEFLVSDISEFLWKVTAHGGSIISDTKTMPWWSINAEISDIDGNIFPIHQK
jgi:predicted enzyme related to lactoylglutathione lyase